MSSSSAKEVDMWSSAQLKEKLEGLNPDQLEHVVRKAPLFPDEVVEVLVILRREYDPDWEGAPDDYSTEDDPRDVAQVERYREIAGRWISKAISTATRNGRDRMVNGFLGVVEQETSIEDIDALIRFARWVTREAGVTYLAGHMGTGKTDFGLLMLEVFYKQLKGAEGQVHVATNVRSCAENHEAVDFIDNQPDLQKWLEENNGYKMFLFDEASSHATGYSGDASKVTKQFRSMIRLIRKHDGSMTIIGHDGKDLHPTVRELADYVEKEDKKDAGVFQAVEDREGKDKRFDISEIPQTNWYYDTKEASSWEWASEGEEGDGKPFEVIMGETYVETELTQSEVGEIFDVSQSKVSEGKKAYLKWQESGAEA